MKTRDMNRLQEPPMRERPPGIVASRVVAQRAYQIWQSHGCPRGTADEDWLQAETELRSAAFLRSGRCDHRHRPR